MSKDRMAKLTAWLSDKRGLTARLIMHLDKNFALVHKRPALHDLFHVAAYCGARAGIWAKYEIAK